VKKQLKALDDVCKLLREAHNAQAEFRFVSWMPFLQQDQSFVTHLPPPDLRKKLCGKFDDHFQNMIGGDPKAFLVSQKINGTSVPAGEAPAAQV
jgi:hypothetical protein